MNLPVFNCLIDENTDDESGIYAMSFVDAPANEVDFIALSAQKMKQEHLCRDSKKQILTGVVLRPEQLIYRNDTQLGEHYIRFSAEQIERIARKMMKTGIALQNTTHQHQSTLKNNYLAELWIVENPENDKSRALGFEPQPKGTLMCSYKIDDAHYWQNQVMTGNVKGFSLEGMFFRQPQSADVNYQNMNKNNNSKMNRKQTKKQSTLMAKLTRFFLDIQSVQKSDATDSGTAYVVFVLADGKEVLTDADGFITLDGQQLPEGDHPLADGNILVVDQQGQFIETKAAAEKNTDPEQAIAPQALADTKAEKPVASSESAETVKAKIADLEARLSELAALAKEANAEVQKLRKSTPSTLPATPHSPARKASEMKRCEKMANALSLSIKSRR